MKRDWNWSEEWGGDREVAPGSMGGALARKKRWEEIVFAVDRAEESVQ